MSRDRPCVHVQAPCRCDKQTAVNDAQTRGPSERGVSINRSLGSMVYLSALRTTYNISTKICFLICVTIAFLLQFIILPVSETYAKEPLEDFPFLISCEYKGTHHAFYFSKLGSDGVATYINPSRLAGTITVGGTAKTLGEPIGGTCLGKTLEQLRASGQASDLRR